MFSNDEIHSKIFTRKESMNFEGSQYIVNLIYNFIILLGMGDKMSLVKQQLPKEEEELLYDKGIHLFFFRIRLFIHVHMYVYLITISLLICL